MRRLGMLMTVIGTLLVSAQAQAYTKAEERLFALNLYHEARQGGRDGMVAVGWVVLNRMKDKGFPGSIERVIRQGGPKPPCQWGWTCDRRSDEPREARLWKLAQDVSKQMLSKSPPADPTRGALWFHETRLNPAYTAKLQETTRVGGNVFYRR